MIRRREDRLHQTPDYEPVDGPPGKRYRSVWSHQPTYLFYGIILAALLMFDGVELIDQDHRYPRANPSSFPFHQHLLYPVVNDPPAKMSTTYRQVANPDHYRSSNSSSVLTQTEHLPYPAAKTVPASTTRPVASSEKPTPHTNAGSRHGTTKHTVDKRQVTMEPTAEPNQDITEPTGRSYQTTKTPTVDDEVCTSDNCKDHATIIRYKMNPTVDPCDNFYNYACQGLNQIKIPDWENVLNLPSFINYILLKGLLNQIIMEVHKYEIKPYQIAIKLYKRCIETVIINSEGTKPMLDILDSLGGWPVLKGGAWNSSWSWEKSMKAMRMIGYSTDCLFDVSVGIDLKNRSRRIIYVDQPTLGISREDLVGSKSNKTLNDYFNGMKSLVGREAYKKLPEILDWLNFERSLANITLPNEKRRNATAMYNPMLVKDFQSKYPLINWTDYFNSMFINTSLKIDENETIIVRTPGFMDKLFPLLQKTPNRTIANYVLWRVVHFSVPFLPKLQRVGVITAQQKYETRNMECADLIRQHLPTVAEAIYAKTLYGYYAQLNAQDVANKVKSEFRKVMQMVDWMDAATLNSTLEKLDRMVLNVSYPDEFMDDNILTEYYKDLKIDPKSSYLKTVLDIDQFTMTKNLESLRQVVGNITTYLDPTGIKIYYSTANNTIWFPPHYLRIMFDSYQWPKHMHYATFGSFVGRTIIRSLDDQGWQLEKVENPADLSQTAPGIAFLDKVFCFLKQNVTIGFSNYETVAEKIVDTGGIRMAYHAYKNWIANNGREQRLPDLGLSPEQMFWVFAAQIWCSVDRSEATNSCITNGSTSPDQFRVLESISNLDEFSSDFKCSSGSRMNPAGKCNVW